MATNYIYLHKRKGTNEIRYVGKGRGGRAMDYAKRDPQHREWMIEMMLRNELEIEIAHQGLFEREALYLERDLIFHYRREGEPLFNKQHMGCE